jgi:hypothetical protein
MNRNLSSLATLFAAGAFAATAASPRPLASTARHGADSSLVEAGCGGEKPKEGEKEKDASCGKDKKGAAKDGTTKKGAKDGSCGKGKKGTKDGSCGKDKKDAGDKKDAEKGCGASCGAKKKD